MQDNQRQAVLIAYLSGIIDGEGTIGIIKFRGVYNPSFGIGMADKEIIRTFYEMFSPENKMQIERVPNRKVIYRFRCLGRNKVKVILETFLPYLRVKKAQVELVLEYCNTFDHSWKKKRMGKCNECGREKYLRAWDKCNTCYIRMRKIGTKPSRKKFKMTVPKGELLRREELYQKVKKLNASGAAATTK